MPESQQTASPTTEDAQAQGKSLRKTTPRSSHGEWVPAPDRSDPLALLQAQDEGRLQHLLPIKYGRMLESPFAFLRGSAAVMAADLASSPVTGIQTIICGDAHLANFGVFASPERKLVFDINDLDEAYPGPWEWDLKRLAASVAVAGREYGYSDKVCKQFAVTVAKAYRKAMAEFAAASTLDMWYYHVDADAVLRLFEKAAAGKSGKAASKMVKKAHTRTQEQSLDKLTVVEDGRRRIISDPPLLVPLRKESRDRFINESEESLVQELTDEERQLLSRDLITNSWQLYLDSLPDERRYLLQRYRITDIALRVVGVGSVGTRCYIVVLQAESADDALILQLKEAGPSSLAEHLPRRSYDQEAQRVVTGQRLIQATSDIFLGWHTGKLSDRDYYWRQLKDKKGSLDVEDLDEDGFHAYAALCSWCLARAHARTGDERAILGYIGRSDTFAKAIGRFALAYADQTERDYEALAAAVREGRIAAETGI